MEMEMDPCPEWHHTLWHTCYCQQLNSYEACVFPDTSDLCPEWHHTLWHTCLIVWNIQLIQLFVTYGISSRNSRFYPLHQLPTLTIWQHDTRWYDGLQQQQQLAEMVKFTLWVILLIQLFVTYGISSRNSRFYPLHQLPTLTIWQHDTRWYDGLQTTTTTTTTCRDGKIYPARRRRAWADLRWSLWGCVCRRNGHRQCCDDEQPVGQPSLLPTSQPVQGL